MIFYGTVSFKDKSLMRGSNILGVWRDEITWMCGNLNKEELYRSKKPQQMNEFLKDIGEYSFIYMTIEQAKSKL